MNVTWAAPAIGHTSVPLGIDGAGELTWNKDGLVLRGNLQSKNAGSLFGCLGFFLTFGLVVGVGVALKIESRAIMILPLGGLFAGLRLARVVFPPKPVELRVPWAQVKKVRLDTRQFEGVEHVAFDVSPGVFSFKPKGTVYFRPVEGNAAPAFEEFAQGARENGLTVS